MVVNGGFEPAPGGATYVAVPGGSSAITGWTTSDSGVEWFKTSTFGFADSANGGWVVDLANLFHPAGGVAQSFATVAGTTYQVDFEFGTSNGFFRDGTAEIVVAAGATSQLFSISNFTTAGAWEARTISFVATAASSTLSFRCLQDANTHFAFIDGVSVAALVPMPAPVTLAGVGLVAVTGGSRRRSWR